MSEEVDSRIFDPQSPSFLRDPYPIYARLREWDPIHRSAFGYWVLTRYAEVAEALSDPRLSSAPAPYALVNRRNSGRHLAADIASRLVAFQDPPAHTAPRRAISAEFRAQLRGRAPAIEAAADRLLARLPRAGRIEFVRNFCTPFEVDTISELVGYPAEDAALLKQWSSWFFRLFTHIPAGEVRDGLDRALREFRAYTSAIVEQRRLAPQDDLVSRMLRATRESSAFGEPELIDNCMLIFSDGIENVASGLASAVATLLRHPEQLERMVRDPCLTDAAVQECLRFDAPGQFAGRIAREDFELGTRKIRAGDTLLLVLASANRDPSVFRNPDRVEIGRDGDRHLSFGRGPHACMGSALVAMEFRIALRALFDGSRGVSLVDEEIEYLPRMSHRWPAALRLDLEPSATQNTPG